MMFIAFVWPPQPALITLAFLITYCLSFEQDSGYKVDVIAAGTGKALKMGENGDVDLVMTHAPKAEATFVDQGFGVMPRKLMYNDFVVVGAGERSCARRGPERRRGRV